MYNPPRTVFPYCSRGIVLSHKLIPSPNHCLDHIRVLQLSSKLANNIINHMLTSGHVPLPYSFINLLRRKHPTGILFLPHKPISAPNHSFYIPIPDFPPDLAHHVHDRRSALISRLFPDCFVDYRL